MMTIAQTHTVNLTPHTWRIDIAIAANLHLVSNLNVVTQRIYPEEPLMEFDRSPNFPREELLVMKFEAKSGFIKVPTCYGLGIEVDEDNCYSLQMRISLNLLSK